MEQESETIPTESVWVECFTSDEEDSAEEAEVEMHLMESSMEPLFSLSIF